MAAAVPNPWSACARTCRALLLALACSVGAAQGPAPVGTAGVATSVSDRIRDLVATGEQALAAEDPLHSWRTFQAVAEQAPELHEGLVGLGRSHLLLGSAGTAIAYAECALLRDPERQDAMTLAVRARIRAREFDAAVRCAEAFVKRSAADAELLAAQASALFRVQRIDDAAAVYRAVLARDPVNAEAHLRLGSGLSAPRSVVITAELQRAAAASRAGRLAEAVQALAQVLAADPDNPVAHRLLGEVLLQQRTLASMAQSDPAFARLRAAWPLPDAAGVPIADFVPAYVLLDGPRKAVVERALLLFATRLPKLIAIGGRHDLLLETERTTDGESRAMLRGRRTFDGRVWDDVRGIGGLHAATGIEALDDAAQFGFDTLVHEVAHQVHYFALLPADRARIRALYLAAKAQGRCLDFYAATNEAEYFGQGVEAFASLGKRPGGETTHGHTRFELQRIDPDLHAFIASIVDVDPLSLHARDELLQAAIAVALRCGRPADAAAAAAMLPAGPLRTQALQQAAADLRAQRSL